MYVHYSFLSGIYSTCACHVCTCTCGSYKMCVYLYYIGSECKGVLVQCMMLLYTTRAWVCMYMMSKKISVGGGRVNYYSTYLVKVTMTELTGNKVLFDCFVDALSKRVDVVDKESESVSAVYNEFSRKLCNTRLNEFIVVQKQLAAAEVGKASLTGQNLRDTLLTQHVQLRSRSKK